MRECTSCKVYKFLEFFRRWGQNFSVVCKDCLNAKAREEYKRKKYEIKAGHRNDFR